MKKTSALKNLIYSDKLEFIMEAHNGISARIVEEAGFKGIWASSLSISASLGVRDNNEASWTQILEILDFMNDASRIPILFDGDTGYGNFNNVRRLVKKVEKIGIAGICLEDKVFPKTNSFIRSETQPLASIDEFCGKIKAACDIRYDKDFMVVARTEAFIAGYGLDEALRRADAYKSSGADAIVVHSKKSNHSDIEAFMNVWSGALPIVIVPTKYYSTPAEIFSELNISLVIWANHMIRASVGAMQKTAARVYADMGLINIEDKIPPVSELFRLQGDEELREAEKKYLPAAGKNYNAVILAAGRGNLGALTDNMPKTLIQIDGKPILFNIIDNLNQIGIKDVTVVRGFARHKLNATNVKFIDNDDFDTTNELYSLALACSELRDNTIVSYGDIVFKSYVLTELVNDDGDIVIVVDADFEYDGVVNHDYVQTSGCALSKKLYSRNVGLVKMSLMLPYELIGGEFIGLMKFSGSGASAAVELIKEMSARPDFKQLTMHDFINEMSVRRPVGVKYIKGSWLNVNNVIDLQKSI